MLNAAETATSTSGVAHVRSVPLSVRSSVRSVTPMSTAITSCGHTGEAARQPASVADGREVAQHDRRGHKLDDPADPQRAHQPEGATLEGAAQAHRHRHGAEGRRDPRDPREPHGRQPLVAAQQAARHRLVKGVDEGVTRHEHRALGEDGEHEIAHAGREEAHGHAVGEMGAQAGAVVEDDACRRDVERDGQPAHDAADTHLAQQRREARQRLRTGGRRCASVVERLVCAWHVSRGCGSDS
eukprot:5451536-Prymnesium_polylepis.1